jgi:hypothetical protein
MYRPVRLLSFASLLFFLANPATAQESAAQSYTHIRTTKAQVRAVMSLGLKVSPTLRAIVEQIESSDVIAYIDTDLLTAPNVAGQSQFVNAAGGKRYVRVLIDTRFNGTMLLGLLGHELQHVAEIAGEPSIVDHRSLAAFYRRSGFRSPAGGTNRFESAAAIVAGRRVMNDAMQRASDVNAAAVRARQGEHE